MFFYIGIFTFCVLNLIINNILKEEKDKKIFEIITLEILCIISGTRYYLGGTDYYVYKKIFDVIPLLENFDFMNVQNIYGTFGVEKGYLFLCSLVKTLGFNFYGFTLIHSTIIYNLLYLGLKKYCKNFNFFIIIFLYKMFFYDTFISLRQSITIVIFFISLKFIENKKIIPYFICCAIATTIHNGALILFFVYFINKWKLSKKRIILLNCIFIPTIILSFLHIPILAPFQWFISIFDSKTAIQKANSLINNTELSGISLIHTMEYFLIMFYIIKNYSDICKQDEHSQFIIKLFLILLPIFTLFRGYAILTREKDYFIFTYAIILQYLSQIKNEKYRTIVQIVAVCICLFGFCRFIVLFDDGGMIPYQTYLNRDISIFENSVF